jgi:hypothetical protein
MIALAALAVMVPTTNIRRGWCWYHDRYAQRSTRHGEAQADAVRHILPETHGLALTPSPFGRQNPMRCRVFTAVDRPKE